MAHLSYHLTFRSGVAENDAGFPFYEHYWFIRRFGGESNYCA